MATTPVLSLPIARDELRKFLPNFQLIKALENLSQDVSVTLPEAIGSNTDAVEIAQATADSAIVQATAAQADADAAQTAITALALRDVPLPLVDAGTILVDAAAHNSFSVTLGGNRTLDLPSNLANGMLLNFAIRQDGTGSRTLAFNAIYDFGAAGTPVLSKTANAVDYVSGYYDQTSNKILCTFRKAVSLAGYFSAHNNAVAQSIPNGAFTKVSLSTEDYDVGSYFASSSWTPPVGRPVQMMGSVFLGVSALNSLLIASIYKNGVEFKRGTSLVNGGVNSASAHVSCIDVPNGTDVYELWVFQSTGGAQNTNGASSLTWFQGTTVQP